MQKICFFIKLFIITYLFYYYILYLSLKTMSEKLNRVVPDLSQQLYIIKRLRRGESRKFNKLKNNNNVSISNNT
jgi:hypothetical protein